jgi:hypothetical protein
MQTFEWMRFPRTTGQSRGTGGRPSHVLFALTALILLILGGCAMQAGPGAETVNGPADTVAFYDDNADGLVDRQEFDEDVDRFDSTVRFDEIDADDDFLLDEEEFGAFEADFDEDFVADTDPFTFFDDDIDTFLDEEEFDEDVDRFDATVGFDDIDADDDFLLNEDEFGAFEDEFVL